NRRRNIIRKQYGEIIKKLKFKINSIVVVIFIVIGLLFVFSDIRKTKDNPDTALNEIQEEETTLFWSEADFNEIRLSNEGDDQEITLLKDEQGNWDTAEPLAEEVNLNKIDQAVSIKIGRESCRIREEIYIHDVVRC